MKRLFACIVTMAVAASAGIAQAQHAPWPADWNNWNDPALWVTVGNAGNVGKWSGESYGGSGPDRVCGAVDYTYQIGKYEVTNAQYREFLAAKASLGDAYGLYDTGTYGGIDRTWSVDHYVYTAKGGDAAWDNRPVCYVSYWDAARFTNWLCNGQGNGDTETGAYTLNGYNGQDGRTITRNSGATYFIPSEDEWYKAAYHKNDGKTGNYWDYPTGSNIVPINTLSNPNPDPGNHANFYQNGYTIGSPYYSTLVGDFENSPSPYGTFDQGGNLAEWNESVVYTWDTGSSRGLRGGDWIWYSSSLAASDRAHLLYPTNESYSHFGFRVAYVPEPSTLALLGMGAIGLLVYAWRRWVVGIVLSAKMQ